MPTKPPQQQTTAEWLAEWQVRDTAIRVAGERTVKPPSNKDQKTYAITPAGTHVARCVQIIDQGTQEVNYEGKVKNQAKIFILYELPLKMDQFEDKDGNMKELPFAAVKTYTNSLYEQSALYKHLSAWLGQPFVEEPESFSYSQIMSRPCMVTVVHNTVKDKTYANIASVTALPDGMECPDQINPSIFLDLDDFDKQVFDNLSERMQDKIALSPEYQSLPHLQSKEGQARLDDGFDDIPF